MLTDFIIVDNCHCHKKSYFVVTATEFSSWDQLTPPLSFIVFVFTLTNN